MRTVFEALQTVDAASLSHRIGMLDAIRALQAALRSGFDPEDDASRVIIHVDAGQLPSMPGVVGSSAGRGS